MRNFFITKREQHKLPYWRKVFSLFLLIFLFGITTLMAKPKVVEKQVEKFLHDFYKIFEMSEKDKEGALQRAASELTEDFNAIFYIPSQKKELLNFDKKAIIEGFGQAFDLYKGKKPVMKIANVVVLPRGESEAVAFFQMDFYLEGNLKNKALSIADLRYEDGGWKMYRQYENKQE